MGGASSKVTWTMFSPDSDESSIRSSAAVRDHGDGGRRVSTHCMNCRSLIRSRRCVEGSSWVRCRRGRSRAYDQQINGAWLSRRKSAAMETAFPCSGPQHGIVRRYTLIRSLASRIVSSTSRWVQRYSGCRWQGESRGESRVTLRGGMQLRNELTISLTNSRARLRRRLVLVAVFTPVGETCRQSCPRTHRSGISARLHVLPTPALAPVVQLVVINFVGQRFAFPPPASHTATQHSVASVPELAGGNGHEEDQWVLARPIAACTPPPSCQCLS